MRDTGAPLPSAPATLVELLRMRAALAPDKAAYLFLRDGQTEETPLTYQALDQSARELAGRLLNLASPGDRVLINHQPGLDYIISFFGCLYAGLTAVPVYPPRFNAKMDRLDAIVEDVKPTLALSSRSIREAMTLAIQSHPALHRIQWIETDVPDPTSTPLDSPLSLDGDQLAFLQYTSGSTSQPKGVMLSHGNLLHNLEIISRSFETDARRRSCSWLPPYHDMGLIGGILEPLYSGMTGVLMSPFSFLMRPLRWLQAISHHKAVFSGGPNFAFELCVRRIPESALDSLDLSSWELAFCGAEPVRSETLLAFAKKFERCGFKASAFYPCFGLAEGTLMASGGKRGGGAKYLLVEADPLELRGEVVPREEPGRGVRRLVGSGQAGWGTRVAIVDPKTHFPVEAGRVGEIWLSGPSVAKGYWQKPNDTETTFRARLANSDSGETYLRTGDLGFLWDDELYVTGRLKDLVILRGRNYYPQDIEQTVARSHPALNPTGCAAFSVEKEGEEKLVIIQELARGAKDADFNGVVDAIRKEVFEEHGINPFAISLIKPNSIPLTSSGKIQRQLSRQLFLQEQLEEVQRVLFESHA